MSRMLNLKQEKKYKNQTINVLTRLNSRSTINKLDKSIKSFKTQRPEVQSSRVQHSSILNKRQSKSKSIQSQSRNGEKSYKSTKKNSMPKYQKCLEQSLQNRLKKIHNIFAISSRNTRSNKNLSRFMQEAVEQFKQFEQTLEDRKQKMLYDDFDYLISSIINSFKTKIHQICSISILEFESQVQTFGAKFQKVIEEFNNELKLQEIKMQKLENHFLSELQNLTIKSLYTTQKINTIQRLGIIDFEKQCRSIDENYNENIADQPENFVFKSKTAQKSEFKQDYSRQKLYEKMYTQGDCQNSLARSNQYFQQNQDSENICNQKIKNQFQIMNPFDSDAKNGKIKKQITSKSQRPIQNNIACQKIISTNSYTRWNKPGGGEFKIVIKDKF